MSKWGITKAVRRDCEPHSEEGKKGEGMIASSVQKKDHVNPQSDQQLGSPHPTIRSRGQYPQGHSLHRALLLRITPT